MQVHHKLLKNPTFPYIFYLQMESLGFLTSKLFMFYSSYCSELNQSIFGYYSDYCLPTVSLRFEQAMFQGA